MEIYEKIDSMFVDEKDTLDLILKELREIKEILKSNSTTQISEDNGFKQFIDRFTNDICEDEVNGIYPEIEIDGYVLGYKDGVLYDKWTNQKFDENKTKEILYEIYNNYQINKKIEELL